MQYKFKLQCRHDNAVKNNCVNIAERPMAIRTNSNNLVPGECF